MKKLILKSTLYVFLILLLLEVCVRIFHLGKDTPTRVLDEYKVEKWMPNQVGFSVTGNRRQNFSEYHINSTGYNSYREFNPTKDKIEIAIVGDSYIEGFHQDYYNSIGKKIENSIPNIEVYEYGYAGYDFADQLHLINAYKMQFNAIDHIFLGIKFSNDLTRNEYQVVTDRLALESPLNKILKKSKLLVYSKNIGILDPPKKLISKLLNSIKPKKEIPVLTKLEKEAVKAEDDQKYLSNFKNLVLKYGYDKKRTTLLLDSRITSSIFIEYIEKNGFHYLDFSDKFEATNKNTTLIYDRHWNDWGRTIISDIISNYIKELKL